MVGLGNPGRRYVETRHNLGWMVLDELGSRLGVRDEREKWDGLRALAGDLTLFKPLTFMNNSGEAVSRLKSDTYASDDELLVVMDDLDLAFGTVRLRPGGSSGGHRGLKSVLNRLGTQDIPRLRLGIGPCPTDMEPKEYVLSRFSEDELPVVNQMVRQAARSVLCWAEEGMETAMSRHNSRVKAALDDD